MTTVQTMLVALAEDKQMSDSSIATMVGCSQPTIWRLRTGKSASCHSDLYVAIATLHANEFQSLSATGATP